MASASLVGAQTLQTLISFNGGKGIYPNALTLGNDGNFYGTTAYGGNTNLNNGSGWGTIFRVTTNGTLTTLVSFNYTNGASPQAALTLGTDGNFYGTTAYDSVNEGTLFQVTTNGTLATLVFFNGTNGATPSAALTLGTDGNFYGTTDGIYGTVFKVTTSGTLTTLVSFKTSWVYPNTLTLGTDGNFYGTTIAGGSNDWGTVFKVTTNGVLTTLVSFNITNGAYPEAALTLGTDGNFYGTTSDGGNTNLNHGYGYGTVFKVTTNGTLTTLVSFNSTNGAGPQAALTLGTDGNFYGTTWYGGSSGNGTVFQITTNGTLTTLVSFNSTNGATPQVAALTLGSDGNFYGTTGAGGSSGDGTMFLLSLSPVITVQPQSQINYAGSTVIFTVSELNFSPMGYQWQKNGTNLANSGNISGANTNTLTIIGILDSDAASYSVIVSNSYGTVTSSNATLTVNDFPFIATQPLSQTIGVGSNVTFTAAAYGFRRSSFSGITIILPSVCPFPAQMFRHTQTNVHTNQSGNYSVLVINGYDSVMSSNAVLTVEAFPPSICAQPSSQRVMIGSSVSFNVSVSGTAPFDYQWCFNGTNILDATNAIYAIQAVAATNAGNYSVVITNSAGSVTSSNALLTVIVPPTVALQLLAGYPVLNLNGMLSNNFTVQYSTNLSGTNWINLRSLSNLSSSPYQFLDPAGVVSPARFYRAFMQ